MTARRFNLSTWWVLIPLFIAAVPLGAWAWDQHRNQPPSGAERASQVDECLRSRTIRGDDYWYVGKCLTERYGWDADMAAQEAWLWELQAFTEAARQQAESAEAQRDLEREIIREAKAEAANLLREQARQDSIMLDDVRRDMLAERAYWER